MEHLTFIENEINISWAFAYVVFVSAITMIILERNKYKKILSISINQSFMLMICWISTLLFFFDEEFYFIGNYYFVVIIIFSSLTMITSLSVKKGRNVYLISCIVGVGISYFLDVQLSLLVALLLGHFFGYLTFYFFNAIKDLPTLS